jgi:hypothetical protein
MTDVAVSEINAASGSGGGVAVSVIRSCGVRCAGGELTASTTLKASGTAISPAIFRVTAARSIANAAAESKALA